MHHPDYQDISRRFRHRKEWNDDQPLEFARENVDLFFLRFHSRGDSFLMGHDCYECAEHHVRFAGERVTQHPPDYLVAENLDFRYPLVRDHDEHSPRRKHRRAVILLHGLNERSFTKYVPWAYQLWEHLRVPILLFPLSFHINRVNPRWGHGQQDTFTRRSLIPGNEHVHRFNAVMSDRLGSHPERFFWGAIQTFWDFVDLMSIIRSGSHPHIARDARIDLLGFSAGGYVALALLLENPRQYFSDSRCVLFSTCAVMRDVSLSSYLIADQAAEAALMNLYVKHQHKLSNPRLRHWLEEHPEGKWFRSFCGLIPERVRLECRLKEIAPRILGIANSHDQVMPPGAMYNALQGIRRDTGVKVEELDLGIHEHPFVSESYDPADRSIISESLNPGRYGTAFERFIELACGAFSNE